MPRFRPDQFLAFLFFLVILVVSGIYQPPIKLVRARPNSTIELVKPGLVPVKLKIGLNSKSLASPSAGFASQLSLTASPGASFTQTELIAQLSAQSLLVLDLPSQVKLLAKQPQTRVYPASTTKLMTALVALQIYQPEQVLTVTPNGLTQGHVVGFKLNEQLTVEDLLAAILINSGNDAAYILANHHPQGLPGFVQQMNQTAQRLGMTQTVFTNPAGFDHPLQQTTAHDLSLLAQELLTHPALKQLVAQKKFQITDLTGKTIHELFNTNSLLGQYPGVVGLKTGTTERAGQVLITLLEQPVAGQTKTVLIVLLNSADRYRDTKLVIEWLNHNYQWFDWQELAPDQ